MSTATAEIQSFEDFEVDKSLISNLIYSQNGTIATALSELVMNSVDALSKTCAIRLGENKFEVEDSGHGFKDAATVKKYFKRFGEQHKDGDAIMGRFRIGRGQIMAFGKVTWHSNEFKMITDVKHLGNGFEFKENKSDSFAGCKVSGDFYKPMKPSDVKYAQEEIKKRVRYIDIHTTFNGLVISNQMGQQQQWNYEDEDVRICWNPSRHENGVYLYSLGVFVKEIPNYALGINADVVTKKALVLNMARNEISEQDPLWLKIYKLLHEKSLAVGRESFKKSKTLDDQTRTAMIKQFLAGALDFDEARCMPLIKDCRGHNIATHNLWFNGRPVTVSPDAGNRISERLASTKTATVLHHDELRVWNVDSADELLELFEYKSALRLKDHHSHQAILNTEAVDFDVLSQGIDSVHKVLTTKELTRRQIAARAAIQYGANVMADRLSVIYDQDVGKRKITIGESLTAEGWTDSKIYIAIEKNMTALLELGIEGAVQLANLLIHEYCHDESDIGSHEHNFLFYEKYHDLTSNYKIEIVGSIANLIYKKYLRELVNRNENLPATAKSQHDYPIINDVHEYSGQFKGDLKLSKLALLFLVASKATFKQTKSRLTASININDSFKLRDRLINALVKEIKSEGEFTFKDKAAVRLLHGRWDTETIISEDISEVASKWATHKGHDANFIAGICNPSKDFRFYTLLALICRDKDSGLLHFERKSIEIVRHFGSGSYQMDFHTQSNLGYAGRKIENIKLASSKNERFAFAIQGIKDIANSFTNHEEKEEFLKSYFTKDFSIQIEVKDNDVC